LGRKRRTELSKAVSFRGEQKKGLAEKNLWVSKQQIHRLFKRAENRELRWEKKKKKKKKKRMFQIR